MIDEQHRQKFKEVWEKGNYRLGSTAFRMVPRLLALIPEGATINDYGCGTGRAEVELLKWKSYKINMIDIAENALEIEARALLQQPDGPLQMFVTDLSDLSGLPHADWGICINVLMTVQPDKLALILSGMRRTCDNLIAEVYDWSDVRLGVEYTTIQQDHIWWENQLKTVWPFVNRITPAEHPRRYIFMCRFIAEKNED